MNPAVRRVAGSIIVAAVVGTALGILPFIYPPETNRIFMQAIYVAIAAMGLNLLTGYNGQISIGHGAFFGVGAFTTGLLMTKQGWSFEATIPVAAALSALLGMAVGFPALRVKGLYLALVTLGLAVMFPQLASKWVHGSGGIALLRPSTRSFDPLVQGLTPSQWQYLLCLVIAVVLFLLAWNLMHSRIGRAMIAVRDQELAASAMGVNVSWVKVGTFALSAAYAGIAGSLSVMVNRLADGTNPILYFQLSIEFLVAVVIGGSATIAGPAVGAIILVFIQRNSQSLIADKPVLSPAVLGATLILLVYVLPDGAVGGLRRLWRRLARSSKPNQSDPTPPGVDEPEPLPTS